MTTLMAEGYLVSRRESSLRLDFLLSVDFFDIWDLLDILEIVRWIMFDALILASLMRSSSFGTQIPKAS